MQVKIKEKALIREIYKGIYVKRILMLDRDFITGNECYVAQETFEQSITIHIKKSEPLVFFECVLVNVEIPEFNVDEYTEIYCPSCRKEPTPTGKNKQFKCSSCGIIFSYAITKKEEE